MKIALNTTYFSNGFVCGNSYTIIELTRGQARRILKLRKQAIAFMERKVQGRASLRVPFAGLVRIFADNDETIEVLAPLREGDSFVRLPDDFQVPENCACGRIELESLSFHHDGELWLDASAPSSGDYLETKIPLQVFELTAQ